VANRTEENGVEGPQLPQAAVRHHFPGLHVGFATPVKRVALQAKIETLTRCLEHTQTFRNDLFSDAVSGDNRDIEGFHRS
jgi:hypothetical protein